MAEQIFISIEPQDLLNQFTETLRQVVRSEIEAISIPPPPDELITRKVAAKLLGVSLPTLGAYTQQGQIPVYRIGSRVRYRKNEVMEAAQLVKKYGRQ